MEYLTKHKLETNLSEILDDTRSSVAVGKVKATKALIGPTPKERYAVRKPIMSEALQQLGVGTPSVDAFADHELYMCPRWWGPGSIEEEDAFNRNWGDEPLLWINPPFSFLDQVVNKIRQDKAKAVLVMPEWEDHTFFESVQPLIVRRYLFPKGTRVFEQKSGAMPGIRWPLCIAFVDGNRDSVSK